MPNVSPERTIMKTKYSVVTEGRTADVNRFWTVFQVMSAINGGMIALSASMLGKWGFLPVAIVGMLLCLLWRGMQLRYALWCQWWDKKMEEIEAYQRKEADLPPSSCPPQETIGELPIFQGRRIDAKYTPSTIEKKLIIPIEKIIKKHLLHSEDEDLPGLSSKMTPVLVAQMFTFAWCILFFVSLIFSLKGCAKG